MCLALLALRIMTGSTQGSSEGGGLWGQHAMMCGCGGLVLLRGKLKSTLSTHCTDQELYRCLVGGGRNKSNGG